MPAYPVSYTHLDVYKRQAVDLEFSGGGESHLRKYDRCDNRDEADELRHDLPPYIFG